MKTDFILGGSGKGKKKLNTGLIGLQEVVFPHICVICNSRLDRTAHCLCSFCCDRFLESAEPEPSEEICPGYVTFHVSLWEFRKGSVLQGLMHSLKYENMYGIGLDFGQRLGKRLKSDFGREPGNRNLSPFLLPVPLHKKRQRKRGYNQARAIAEGVAGYTGWPVSGEGSVVRTRNTGPQSGLSVRERRKNMASAFRIVNLNRERCQLPVIVDDIFTTGATTFELAGTLVRYGFSEAGIATAASA